MNIHVYIYTHIYIYACVCMLICSFAAWASTTRAGPKLVGSGAADGDDASSGRYSAQIPGSRCMGGFDNRGPDIVDPKRLQNPRYKYVGSHRGDKDPRFHACRLPRNWLSQSSTLPRVTHHFAHFSHTLNHSKFTCAFFHTKFNIQEHPPS